MPDDDLLLPPRLLAMPSYVLSLLGRAARAGSIEAVGAATGLRLGHVAALAALKDFGPSSQRALGARLRQDPSDMVKLLDELEGRALVRRERDPDDRRRHRVTLTADGRRALTAAERAVAREERALLAPLSADERDELQCLAARVLAARDPGARVAGEPRAGRSA